MAIALGMASGLALDSLRAPPEVPTAKMAEAEPDPEVLARVEALHDEARALTAAEVALDESTHERWMPRIAKIEEALEDPATPEPIRAELLATIAALECVGVLEHTRERRRSNTCVTLPR